MLRRRSNIRGVLFFIGLLVTGCGPKARIPGLAADPRFLPHAVGAEDPDGRIARSLAPILYLQRDEWFSLERIAAVVHPTRRIIAYHLLWRDDAHGSWIPFTVPTDQEIVWVGYDTTGAPTDVWTFWHGKTLHADWRDRGAVTVNVQWGKHGSLPRGIIESDLPAFQKLGGFYAFAWLGIWDMWLGKLTRPGPGCFCHGFGRYREFTRPLLTGERIDVVARTENPKELLAAVFGKPFSKKRAWP